MLTIFEKTSKAFCFFCKSQKKKQNLSGEKKQTMLAENFV